MKERDAEQQYQQQVEQAESQPAAVSSVYLWPAAGCGGRREGAVAAGPRQPRAGRRPSTILLRGATRTLELGTVAGIAGHWAQALVE